MKIRLREIEEIAIEALKRTYEVHQRLGARGEELVRKNTFGDTALRVDIESEKVIIEAFKDARVPIKIISEEHGTIEITDNPIYLGVLDGLDGSNRYKKRRGIERYGAMLGIFSGLNPKYKDYLFSRIMEHSTNRLFYAIKDKGSFVLNDGVTNQIRCSDCRTLNNGTKIYIDEKEGDQKWHPFMKETFSDKLKGFNLKWLGSSAVYYADLACGQADLVLECTRKGNLEIAVAYGLENEAGGVMMTLDFQDIASKKYLEFGQKKHIPVISASTRELAQELIKHICKY